ncbi:amino acid carrier protein [Thermaerobacter marianensis DSM 12885]|uniref:Amino acid carrier protein n=1 Tax=Thermaerobacter marianensis (strain ATCC 700841 / DSM 12885 / JCM 10246 / 7p75a) TaxID=644966 RepID=E6SI80_THEM7|nr:sodium:alanine symporter family protein [Thermaerobacter marianensis]ADU50858.1 amino acid carrier protein [Thermaerobacter marianensis DSM 12885]
MEGFWGTLAALLSAASDFVWGPPMLVLIVGTGLFLTIRLRGLQFRELGYALRLAFSRRQDQGSEGDVNHFQALMTALAATVGTGNIAGVAAAVTLGGPGAVFWMWVTALVGMATKYAEAILAVTYRVRNARGEMAGGPMYALERGLGQKWLAVMFALSGAIAGFGIGNTVQAYEVANNIQQYWGVPSWITGLVMAVLTGLVILGGIKSIGRVTAVLVPFMALFYVIGGLIILARHLDAVPGAIALILSHAFTGEAVGGGVVGAGVREAIRWGVARGVFSNEAGLGSAPIAAAAAKTDIPARQALVSMTGTFIDTVVVCSVTGLVLVATGMWQQADPQTLTGAQLTTRAFEVGLPGPGGLIVVVGLILFAYSTILGWAYYGEKCFEYLFGTRAITVYRAVWTVAVFAGSVATFGMVWDFADVMNGLMAVPNLISLLALSGVVVRETERFFATGRQVVPGSGQQAVAPGTGD